ncbi:MAG: NAD(P)-dependent oxidoreductase [Pirellulaceae bacterium]
MRILVTGSSGLLGAALAWEAFRRGYVPWCGYHSFRVTPPRGHPVQCDLRDAKEVESLVREVNPDLVIHSAAATNVDQCELQPDYATASNVGTTQNLAKSASAVRAQFVYISTDAVYGGIASEHIEGSLEWPVNVYARTKLQGELVASQECGTPLIVRTTMFGWNIQPKMSLAEWMLRQYEARKPFPGFSDVRFSPLFTGDLARLIFELAEKGSAGVHNLGSSDACSKYDFGRLIADVCGMPKRCIYPEHLEESDGMTPRPLNTAMNVDKAAGVLKRRLPTVKEGIEHFWNWHQDGTLDRFRQMGAGSK